MKVIWAPSIDSPMNEAIKAFMGARIWPGTTRRLPDDTLCFGVFDHRNTMIAGVGYHSYDPDAGVIEYVGASDSARWLTRPVLWEMHSYPFDIAGCQLLVGRNDPDNARLIRQQLAYKYQMLIVPRLRGRNKSEALMTLTVEDWRANGFHPENQKWLAHQSYCHHGKNLHEDCEP